VAQDVYARQSVSSEEITATMNLEQTADHLARGCYPTPVAAARPERDQAGAVDAWINTIQLFRFPLALAVVAVHSGQFVLQQAAAGAPVGGKGGLGLWLVEFLTMVSRLAAPSFLVIAGIVFFRNGPVTFEQYRRKLGSRFYTLLLPYLAWNFIAVLLLYAPSACRHYLIEPAAGIYSPCSFRSLAIWLVGWPVFPADAPLWFVRDLLILVTVAPLLTLLPKRVQLLGISSLALYWLMGPRDVIPGGIPRAGSVLFFLAGAWIGMNRISLRGSPGINRIIPAAAGVFVCSVALGAFLATQGQDEAAARALVEKIVRASGALLVVCAATKPARVGALRGLLLRLSPLSFFLFASHHCSLFCLAVLSTYFPHGHLGGANELLRFGATFSAVVLVSLGGYFLLKRYAPSLLSLLDGNRSAGAFQARRGERQPDASALPISLQRVPAPFGPV